MKLLLVFIACGILFMSLFIHEGFHLIESVDPISVCYGFDDGNIASVEAKDFKTKGEFFAYYFQTLFITGCLLYIMKLKGDYKNGNARKKS